jgi:hypothetical protein
LLSRLTAGLQVVWLETRVAVLRDDEVAAPGRALAPRMILTPNQRLRVFVSSKLGELAAEREAVRRAVESLELTLVLFELRARPHPPRSLYREREVGELSKLLAPRGARLVTLAGPGGVGKTRLALETASGCREHFPGGVFFAPLAAVEDPAGVPVAVARALGLNAVGEKSEADAIGEFFGDRRALVVLGSDSEL